MRTEFSLAVSPRERNAWFRIKALPHLLVPPLTSDQELAVELQLLIDNGHIICAACEAMTERGAFCGQCGKSTGIEPRQMTSNRVKCGGCNTMTSGRFCHACGLRLLSEEAETALQQMETDPVAAAREAVERMEARRRKLLDEKPTMEQAQALALERRRKAEERRKGRGNA